MTYPIAAGTLFVMKGRLLKDEILERQENHYWKWTIYNFKTKTLFFAAKAIGEWKANQMSTNIVNVTYTYTY